MTDKKLKEEIARSRRIAPDIVVDHEELARLRLKPWSERFAEAKARGRFTDYDARAAAHWPTCAVGNLCEAIPRNPVGGPIDDRLVDLGRDFMREVENSAYGEDLPDAAIRTFEKIEKRASEILAEMAHENMNALITWSKNANAGMPRSVLWDIARAHPRTLRDLRGVQGLGPGRIEKYGLAILRVIRSVKAKM